MEAEQFYKHNLVAGTLDARRSTLVGYRRRSKSLGWEIEEASGESIGRPLNGRPMDSQGDMAGFVVNSQLHNRECERLKFMQL